MSQLVRFEPRTTPRVSNLTRGTLHPHAAPVLRHRRPERERLPFSRPTRRVRPNRITVEEFAIIAAMGVIVGLLAIGAVDAFAAWIGR